ncbi:hypothetical protein E2C01_059253 [Portunus trituberculatus]|uniref:Uncharacterized protein n=1 Tax=Portunus trituberculatus TaxID=210409 RepID=A0A5B7H6A7_PORTR|nr:hypothetical protein [Portunus trituberculatus]
MSHRNVHVYATLPQEDLAPRWSPIRFGLPPTCLCSDLTSALLRVTAETLFWKGRITRARYTNRGAETQLDLTLIPNGPSLPRVHHRQSPLCSLPATVFLLRRSAATALTVHLHATSAAPCADAAPPVTAHRVLPSDSTVPRVTKHTMKACKSESSDGVLEVLLSLLLGLNSPQARTVQDSSGLQATLLLLLRDLLLEGGTQPPDNLLHLIARMQKTHQRRQRRRQRAALRQQGDKETLPRFSSSTSHHRPAQDELLASSYAAFLLNYSAESGDDFTAASCVTKEDGLDDAARPRPS